jgi:hypothetical protein
MLIVAALVGVPIPAGAGQSEVPEVGDPREIPRVVVDAEEGPAVPDATSGMARNSASSDRTEKMASVDLAPDPSFEAGSGWTASVDPAYPGSMVNRNTWGIAEPRTGTYAYAMSNLAFGRWASPNIQVESGEEYTLSAWVRGVQDTDEDMHGAMIKVLFKNASGVALSSVNTSTFFGTLPSDWTQVSGGFTTPSDCTQIEIRLIFMMGSGWVAFDDVSVVPIDEKTPSPIVPDAGFESGGQWQGIVVQPYASTTLWRGSWGPGEPHTGSFAAVITNHAYGRLRSEKISGFQGATDYEAAFDVRGGFETGESLKGFKATAEVRRNDVLLDELIIHKDITGQLSTTWQRPSLTLTTPANVANLTVEIVFEFFMANGWVAVDDVFVGPDGTTNNLLANPGFESTGTWSTETVWGSTAFWRGSWGIAEPSAGSYAYSISNHPFAYLDSDLIGIEPNAQYTLSAWFRGEIDTDHTRGSPILRASFYAADGTWIENQQVVVSSWAMTENWTQHALPMVSPSNAASMTIQISHFQASGWIAIDDVELVRNLPVVEFATPSITVNEADGTVILSVAISRAPDDPVSAQVSPTFDSASPDDVGTIPTTVAWAAGDGTPKAVAIPINSDGIDEHDEVLTVSIDAPVGAAIGGTASTQITIADSDVPMVSPAKARFVGREGETAILEYQIAPAPVSDVEILLTATDGTAVSPTDYHFPDTTIFWAAGDDTPKTASLSVVSDGVEEGIEEFELTAAALLGSVTVVGDSQHTVQVLVADVGVAGLHIESGYFFGQPLNSFGAAVVPFVSSFANPPIVFLQSLGSGMPRVFRCWYPVLDVDSLKFEARQLFYPQSCPTSVDYLAVEPGVYSNAAGGMIVADTVQTSSVIQHPSAGASGSWTTYTFPVAFADPPSILAQLQSASLWDQETGWPLCTSVAIRNVQVDGFEFAIEGMDCTDDLGAIVNGELPSPETIGFLAVSRGVFQIGNLAANSQHMDPTTPTEYWTCDPSTSFDVPLGLAFAGALTRNNQSGVLAELCGNMWPPVSEHPHNVSVHSTPPDGVVYSPVLEEYSLVSFSGDLFHSEPLPTIALEVDGDGGDDGHTITVDEATPGQEASFRITSTKPWLPEIYVEFSVSGPSGWDQEVVLTDQDDQALDLSQPVVVPRGAADFTIKAKAVQDGDVEGLETITISISHVVDADSRVLDIDTANSSIDIDVGDDDDPDLTGIVPACVDASLSSVDLSNIAEADTTITCTLDLGITPSGVLVLGWETQETGTASGSADFELKTGLMTFSSTTSSAGFGFQVFQDEYDEETETFSLVFKNSAGVPLKTVPVSIVDDDTAGILGVPDTSGGAIEVWEGHQPHQFSVSLGSQPEGVVALEFSPDDGSQVWIEPAIIEFNPEDPTWSSPRTVSVIAVEDHTDDIDLTVSVSMSVFAPDDPLCAAISLPAFDVVAHDLPTVGFDQPGGPATVSEEAQGTISVELEWEGTYPVSIDLPAEVSASSEARLGGSFPDAVATPSSLVFNLPADSTASSTIQLAVQDDQIADTASGEEELLLELVGAVGAPVNVDPSASTWRLLITDQESAGVEAFDDTGVPSGTYDLTEGQSVETIGFRLASQPQGTIELRLNASDPRVSFDVAGSDPAVALSILSFTPANWDSTQFVRIVATDDTSFTGTVPYSVNAIVENQPEDSAYHYRTFYSVLSGNLIEASSPPTVRVELAPSSLGSLSEGEAPEVSVDVYVDGNFDETLVLNPAVLPITPPPGGQLATPGDDFTLDTQATLTWDGASIAKRSFTFTVRDDDAYEGIDPESIGLGVVVAPGSEVSPTLPAAPVVVQVVDDETLGIVGLPTSLEVVEGQSPEHMRLRLASTPSGVVTVAFAADPAGQITIQPTSIQFDPASGQGWNDFQLVQVSAVQDSTQDGSVAVNLTASVSSLDTWYGSIEDAMINVTAVDSDAPRAVISRPINRQFYNDQQEVEVSISESNIPDGFGARLYVLPGTTDPASIAQPAYPITEPVEPQFAFNYDQLNATYSIRLFVAPIPDLSGIDVANAVLPCADGSMPLCASTEVFIEKAAGYQTHMTGFRLATTPTNPPREYLFPEALALVWDQSIEIGYGGVRTFQRSEDGGQNWVDLPRALDQTGVGGASNIQYSSYRDTGLNPGNTYHYRWQAYPGGGDDEWVYLGSTTEHPGLGVTTPVWPAVRPVPTIESIDWHCPDGASIFTCHGTATLRLEPEPGGDLTGTRIQVFVNEPTFDMMNGEDEFLMHVWPVHSNGETVPAMRRDEPACYVVDGQTPIQVGQVDNGYLVENGDTVSIPVIYGANGVRFEIFGPDGDNIVDAQRAILLGMHEIEGLSPETLQIGIEYPKFLPVLFGSSVKDSSYRVWGIGPAGRHSPDCGDLDQKRVNRDEWGYLSCYFNSRYAHPQYWAEIDLDGTHGSQDYFVATDENGRWPSADTEYSPDWTQVPSFNPDILVRSSNTYCREYGYLGRRITALGAQPDDENELLGENNLAQVVWMNNDNDPDWPITFDDTLSTDPEAPRLTYCDPMVAALPGESTVQSEIRFRIEDFDHDVDMPSVEVINDTVGGPTSFGGFYAENQDDWEHGDWGWFVADVDFQPGTNDLRVCASDFDGLGLTCPSIGFSECVDLPGEPNCVGFTISVVETAVKAVLSDETADAAESGDFIVVDGSSSTIPDLGLAEGAEAKWAFTMRNPEGHYYQYIPPITVEDESDLRLSVPVDGVQGGWTLHARLFVATDGGLPADGDLSLRPTHPGIKNCHYDLSTGTCDWEEVTVYISAACDVGQQLADLKITTPLTPNEVIVVTKDQPFSLSVSSTFLDTNYGGDNPPLYRWLVYPNDGGTGGGAQFPIAFLTDAPDASHGWSPTNSDLTGISAEDMGLPPGSYLVYAEAMAPAACSGPRVFGRNIVDAANGNPAAISLSVGDTPLAFDGVAPGQVAHGESVRIYSHMFEVGGDPVYVVYDQDLENAQNPAVLEVPVQNGKFVEVNLPVGQWDLALSRNSDGAGWNGVFDAVDVLDPGTFDVPIAIASPEEDESCGGPGTECVRLLIPDQFTRANWYGPGDRDYFDLTLGAGTTVIVNLDAIVGTEDPTVDVREPDPELFVADPKGLVTLDTYSDDRAPDNRGSTVEFTAKEGGVYRIIALAGKGAADYVLHADIISRQQRSGFEAVPFESPSYLATTANPTAEARVSLLDLFGDPVAGAPVRWIIEEGSATVSASELTSRNGIAVADVTSTDGRPVRVVPQPLFSPTALKTYKLSNPGGGPAPNPPIGLLRTWRNAALGYETLSSLSAEQVRDYRSKLAEHRKNRQKSGGGPKVTQVAACHGPGIAVGTIQMPANAVGVTGIEFTFVDDTGTPVERFEDITVQEATGPFHLQAEIQMMDVDDPTGARITMPGDDIPISIQVVSPQPDADDQGKLGFDEASISCSEIRYMADGSAPTDLYLKPGKKAYFAFTKPGPGDRYHYSDAEALWASVVLPVTISGTNPGNSVRKAQTDQLYVSVAPEPSAPRSADFYGLEGNSAIWHVGQHSPITDPLSGEYIDRFEGPSFSLKDRYDNTVAEYGAIDGGIVADSARIAFRNPHHTDPPVEFYIEHSVEMGSRYEPNMQRLWLVDPADSEFPIVWSNMVVDVVPEDDLVDGDDSPFEIAVNYEMRQHVPILTWRCIDPMTNTSVWCTLDVPRVKPGGTLLGDNGQELYLRLHITRSDQFGDPRPSIDIDMVGSARVYVSGPSRSGGVVLIDPTTQRPLKVDDVAFGYRNLHVTVPDGNLQVDVLSDGEAEGEIPDAQAGVGYLNYGATDFRTGAVSVRRAPKRPGYYWVIAEPIQGDFQQYTGWYRRLEYLFLVEGAAFLNEDYSAPVDYKKVDAEKKVIFEYVSIDDPGDVWLRFEDVLGNVKVVDLELPDCPSVSVVCRVEKEIFLVPELTDVDPPCDPPGECVYFEIPPVPFKIEAGLLGEDPYAGLEGVLDTMWGHGAVHEIPIGQYRRLTYAVHSGISPAGAFDEPLAVEWQPSWAGGGFPVNWFSSVVDPTTDGSTLNYSLPSAVNEVTRILTYDFDSNAEDGNGNNLNIPPTTLSLTTTAFKVLHESGDDAGFVMAFHAAADSDHPLWDAGDSLNRFLPPDSTLKRNGYGPARVPLTISPAGSSDPGESAVAGLRGTVPSRIQSEYCASMHGDNADRMCASKPKGDLPTTEEFFSLDNLILYFADRYGLPPDVIKAIAVKESGQVTRTSAGVGTNRYKYEPYTFDFRYFAGGGWDPQGGRRCDNPTPNYDYDAHRIEVVPFCQYAFSGRMRQSDGIRAATVTPSLASPYVIDLRDVGFPNHVRGLEQLKLFDDVPQNSPNCITKTTGQTDPPDCTPDPADFGVVVSGYEQVARYEHGKPNPKPHAYVEYPGVDPPAAGQYSVEYGLDTARVTLGSAPTATTQILANVQLQRQLDYEAGGPGWQNMVLNNPVADIGLFLDSLSENPNCKTNPMTTNSHDQPTSDSISEWFRQSRVGCGGFNFIRDGTAAHPNLMVNGSDFTLYDPQFTVNAQYLLAGTFGLMQYGILNHNYETISGKFLRMEMDFGADGFHLFDQVLNPAVSVQIGSAFLYWKLYRSNDLSSVCPSNCSIEELRGVVHEAVGDYNGGGTNYSDLVFAPIYLFSYDSTIWGIAQNGP